nr:immunoglobulin light chain junction region [Macaca mulatta]
CGQGTHLSF